MSTHLIGDPKIVTEGLRALQSRTGADEVMLSTRSHSYETRLRSLSLIAQSWGGDSSASEGANGGQGPPPDSASG